MKKLSVLLSSTLFVLAACGGGSDTDLETAFCIGLGGAADATIAASASPDAAPTAPLGDLRTDVTLADLGGENGGSIVYVPDEDGFFAFGLGADVELSIADASGNDVPIVKTVRGSAMCTELAVRYTAELRAQPYTLTFGPTATATLPIVAEESDDDVTP
ncbi:MAG: hypothetical protein RMA76_20130 [Deltaproteobacteria bacterium]|jgi:hypothetical protein